MLCQARSLADAVLWSDCNIQIDRLYFVIDCPLFRVYSLAAVDLTVSGFNGKGILTAFNGTTLNHFYLLIFS